MKMDFVKRGSVWLALLAVFATVATAQEGKKVTLTLSAQPAKRALAELSKAAGVTLETAGDTADDVIAVRLQNVSLDDAMKRIAQAVNGTWTKTNRGYRLERTAAQTLAEERREIEQDTQAFAKGLAERTAELNKLPEFDTDTAKALFNEVNTTIQNFRGPEGTNRYLQRINQIEIKGPAGRAMARVVGLLDPAELAALPTDHEIVYSSSPTRMERRLDPRAAGAALETFAKDQSLWAEYVAKQGEIKPPVVNGTIYYRGLVGEYTTAPESQPSKVLLALYKSATAGSGVSIEFYIAGSDGQILARARTNIGNRWEGVDPMAAASPNDPEISLSEDTKTFIAAFRGGLAAREAISPELKARLLDPENHDPLSFAASAVVLGVAEAKGLNAVALLPDNLVDGGLFNLGPKVGAQQAIDRLRIGGVDVQLEDGWLVARPERARETRENRASRRALAAYLRDIADKPKLTIDEAAVHALNLPDATRNYLPLMLANVVSRRPVRDYHDPMMLRLWALLTPAQRRALPQGITLSSLTTAQFAVVNRMVYGPVVSRLRYQPPVDASGQRVGDSPYGNYYGTVYEQPTESLPNGVPPDGILKMVPENTDVVFSGEVPQGGWVQPGWAMSPAELALSRFQQERPELFPNTARQRPNLDRLRLGSRTRMSFTFQFNPLLSLSTVLQETEFTPSDPIAYNALPESFRNQVEAQLVELRRRYANYRPTPPNPGNKTIPPAR